ncbi:hypothetical protein [Streptomyces sp. NPDC059874]|uniref:hypothetical protein n=1 Tax=Streptomyces sp. NPDC059874 TaxID=3346983 RepID=UPI00366A331A
MKALTGLLVGLVIGAGTAWGLTAPAQAPTSESDVVTAYNDGWLDGTDDVCWESGDKYACYWVMRAEGIPLPPDAAAVLGN